MSHVVDEHEHILVALDARDPDLADTAMRAHIEAVQKKRIQTLLDDNYGH